MRNQFERGLGAQIKKAGVSFKYETLKVPYILECNYIPDFILANGIVLEGKGRLDTESKRKMIAVKKQHPELDIRFVFYEAHKKISGTKQTHAQWAEKNGFKWCDKEIPLDWLT
jgi:hypothetical protein